MSILFAGLARENYLRGRNTEAFVTDATDFLTELNHIHPFREGNGRAQLVFMAALSDRAGYPLNFDVFEPDEMLAAMIASYRDDKRPLCTLFGRMVGF